MVPRPSARKARLVYPGLGEWCSHGRGRQHAQRGGNEGRPWCGVGSSWSCLVPIGARGRAVHRLSPPAAAFLMAGRQVAEAITRPTACASPWPAPSRLARPLPPDRAMLKQVWRPMAEQVNRLCTVRHGLPLVPAGAHPACGDGDIIHMTASLPHPLRALAARALGAGASWRGRRPADGARPAARRGGAAQARTAATMLPATAASACRSTACTGTPSTAAITRRSSSTTTHGDRLRHGRCPIACGCAAASDP